MRLELAKPGGSRQAVVVPSPPVRIRPPLHTCAASAILFAGTVLLYNQSLGYDFVNYDDPSYITNNLHVRAGLTWDSFVWACTNKTDYWHPLTWLAHMLDWQLFGDNAAGHRLVSVLWHAANAVLTFQLLRRLTGVWWSALFSAALFAWHPLRVESVVWVTERKDVMSGFFFLLTLWVYVGYVDGLRAGRKAGGTYALTLALFTCGLMCKPMLVTVPVVLLIVDFWPFQRAALAFSAWRKWRDLVTEKIPFFILSTVVSVMTVVMQRNINAFVLHLSLNARVGNMFVAIVRYLGQFFWPSDLVVCYPHPGWWPWPVIVAALAFVISLSALSWRQHTARPWMLAGWLWFLVMLLPAIGLIQVGFQAMADRYTYLPILGWQLVLLWTLRSFPLPKMLLCTVAAVTLTACAAGTWRQQAYWRDSLTLFQHAVEVNEENGFAHSFLSFTLFNLNQLEEATRHGERALLLQPDNQTARYTLGCVQERQGLFTEAASNFQHILQLSPGQTQARYMQGIMLLRLGHRAEAMTELKIAAEQKPEFRQANLDLALTEAAHGQPDKACLHFEVAVELDPQNAAAHHGYATALTQLGRLDEAQEQLEITLRLQPNHPAAHAQLGLILLVSHRPDTAVDHFRATLAIQPDDPTVLAGLGQAEEQLGRTDEATMYFSRARELAPRDAGIHRAWAEILMRRGQYEEATRIFTQLLSIRPDDAEGHASLGYALILGGHRTEAIPHWEEALRLKPDFPGLRERLQRIRP